MVSGTSKTSSLTVVCTGLVFYVLDSLFKNGKKEDVTSMSNTLQTFQSVVVIMFTNSLVSWCMDSVSSAAGGTSGLGNAAAAVVCGLVVTRTIIQLLDHV